MSGLAESKDWSDKIDALLRDMPLVPRMATILVTLRCNSHCFYCNFGRSDNTASELPADVVLRRIGQVRRAGIREVCFTGGEPLTWAPLVDVLTETSNQGMRATLLTNGTLLTGLRLRELISAGLGMVVISLDSLDPRTYREHRGLNIAPVLRALELLVEARERHEGFGFIATSVVTPETLGSAARFALELEARGVTVQFQPVHGHEPALSGPDPQVDANVESIVALVVPRGAVINHPEYLRHIPKFFETGRPPAGLPCLAGYLYLLIDLEGEVRICNRMESLGNADKDDLAAMLTGDLARTIRERMIRQECPGCWLLCSGQPVLERLSPYLSALHATWESHQGDRA
jgi:MoaA/NifB/PqqE/SkfB family radical SAM enzyme